MFFTASEIEKRPRLVGSPPIIMTTRRRSLGQGNIFIGVCLSTGGSLGLCPGGALCPEGGFLSEGLCPGGSLSKGSLSGGFLSKGSLSTETPRYSE